jgi:predicted dehydrogenase
MRVGVIGVCGFGRLHAEAFAAAGCEVAAVADVAAGVDALALHHGARAYRDYRLLLEHPGLEAVSISLPPRLHPEVIRAAHARALPVLCEKPVAASAAESDALLAELGPDAPVAVGFSLRYDPAMRRLKELVGAGALGRVRAVLARKCWRTSTPWRVEHGGGAVFVKDIHYFDLVPWLLAQEPRGICAFGGSFYHDGALEDSYQLLLELSGGATFHLDSAWWTLADGVDEFEVVGDRARARLEGGALRIEGSEARWERPPGPPAVEAEVRAFVSWLAGAGERPPGLVEAARANRLAQRVRDLLGAQRPEHGRR